MFLNWDNTKNLSFDGSHFTAAASSNYPHEQTSLGKIESGLVAIGGYTEPVIQPLDSKELTDGLWTMKREKPLVELYTNGHWVKQPDFPVKDIFFQYSTATHKNVLYLFGE